MCKTLQVYGPNYDTATLGHELDEMLQIAGGSVLLVFGNDPDLRKMQVEALAISMSLTLTNDPAKLPSLHAPEDGKAAALTCAEKDSFPLIESWVFNGSVPGPRLLIVEADRSGPPEGAAIATSSAIIDSELRDVTAEGVSSGITVHLSTNAEQIHPNLTEGFTTMSAFPDLLRRNAESAQTA